LTFSQYERAEAAHQRSRFFRDLEESLQSDADIRGEAKSFGRNSIFASWEFVISMTKSADHFNESAGRIGRCVISLTFRPSNVLQYVEAHNQRGLE
jgi:hypothetical protein